MKESFVAYCEQAWGSFAFSGKWFIICAMIFIPLSFLLSRKTSTQPLFRKDMVTDSFYWFLAPLLYGRIGRWVIVIVGLTIYSKTTFDLLLTNGKLSPAADLPLWLQVILALLITDIFQYWSHRLFHTGKFWKFHSIHHSPKILDWLSSSRFHPVNVFVHSLGVGAVVYMIGFAPEAYAVLLPFNMVYSPLVHANLNWDYGPFKYLLASPVFHRWHHTSIKEGGNKNFAPTFPFLDVIFGTFYMPEHARPLVFGNDHDVVPDSFIGQLLYPFRNHDYAQNDSSTQAEALRAALAAEKQDVARAIAHTSDASTSGAINKPAH